MAAKKQSYEKSMTELETIVGSLESGELPLEEAIASYEKGMKLVKSLEGMLSGARRRVEILTKEGEIPFEEGEEDL